MKNWVRRFARIVAFGGNDARVGALIGVTAVALSVAAHETGDSRKFVTHSLSVSGDAKKSKTFSVEDVKTLPSRTLTDVAVISKRGMTMIKSLKGVLLKELLDRADVIAKTNGKTKKTFIVATAADGYTAIFSWNELFNSPIGEGVLVAYEKEGAPVPDTEGRFLLVSAKDYMTGSRHVRWLKSVDVRRIDD